LLFPVLVAPFVLLTLLLVSLLRVQIPVFTFLGKLPFVFLFCVHRCVPLGLRVGRFEAFPATVNYTGTRWAEAFAAFFIGTGRRSGKVKFPILGYTVTFAAGKNRCAIFIENSIGIGAAEAADP
jgi:hypothetical protein